MRRPYMTCAIMAVLQLAACAVQAADDPRLANTFYLDGDKQSYVLTIRDDRTFEVLDPKGRKDSGRVNATRREIGFIGGANRHFAYGFDGSNLLLMPTDKDAFALGSPLGEMPPRRENETLKFLSRENWLKAHPEAALPDAVPAATGGSGAGGGAGYESLLAIERSSGKTAAQNEAEYRLYMAAGDREYYSGRLTEAQKQYEYALRFKANDVEATKRITEIQRGGGVQPGTPVIIPGGGGGGWHGGGGEDQVIDLINQGKLDDAQRAADAMLRDRPNSLRLSRLKTSIDQVRAVDTTSAGVQGIAQRMRQSAQDALAIDANEGAAKHASETASQQEGVAAKFPAAARAKLQTRDYDGVAAVLADARGSAQALADESTSASTRFSKKAEDAGEYKGLKIGDVKILGVDQETKKSRKWSGVADSFKQLAREASDLAR